MENQKTQQDLADRGVLAEELLKNETFSAAVKEVVDQCIGTWLNSGEDAKLRENAYYAAQGMNNVIGVLSQWVAIKDQILAEQEAKNEEV